MEVKPKADMDGETIYGTFQNSKNSHLVSIKFTPQSFTEKAVKIDSGNWVAFSLMIGSIRRLQVEQTVQIPKWLYDKMANPQPEPKQIQNPTPTPASIAVPTPVNTQSPITYGNQQLQQMGQITTPQSRSLDNDIYQVVQTLLSRFEDIEKVLFDIHRRLFPNTQNGSQQEQAQPQQIVDWSK